MARKKISEYRAKTILYQALGQPYTGLSVDTTQADWTKAVQELSPKQHYVVKVDEGVKKRFKNGLVLLDQPATAVAEGVKRLAAKGYRHILVEAYQPHEASAEFYLAVERRRAGNIVTFSVKGGVDIESHSDSLQTEILKPASPSGVAQALGLSDEALARLIAAFDDNFFSFLEINPLVTQAGVPTLLDAAVQVDDEAEPFVAKRWSSHDFRGASAQAPQEVAVEELADKSQASFRLEVLNPQGQVFLLLSGGGASVVLADEVYNQGSGLILANYGEYSGNPNAEEVYLYTRQILSLLLQSPAKRKVLVIGGGVANFTDIRVTFTGVIQALDEVKDQLKAAGVKVFVRRGGPFEAEGLTMMTNFLQHEGLYGAVSGPDLPLSDIIPQALASLKETA